MKTLHLKLLMSQMGIMAINGGVKELPLLPQCEQGFKHLAVMLTAQVNDILPAVKITVMLTAQINDILPAAKKKKP